MNLKKNTTPGGPLRRAGRFAALLTCLAFGPLTHAQSPAPTPGAATTQISGRVKNAVNGQYLNNARITIKGSAIVVFTDQSGTYRLNQIPRG
jgi:hypothetical protein